MRALVGAVGLAVLASWLLFPASAIAESLSLAGEWRFKPGPLEPPKSFDAGGWTPITVPSNWYSQGLDTHGVVWFAREVELAVGERRHALEFEGVDYSADVYWDGAHIGGHRGYFAPFRVTLPASSARKHFLAVRVDSPIEPKSAWSLHKTLIKGVLSHHDTRPGNAWSPRGQEANTGGIWGQVALQSAANVFFDMPRVTTLSIEDGRARLRIDATVDGVARRPRYRILSPDGALIAQGRLVSGRDGGLSAEVRLARPQLWWPAGLGAPALYVLEVLAEGGDRRATRFGIRTVSRDADERFTINGIPVFLRGTNYIAGISLADITEERLKRDLDLMQTAHINAVRVHAHVTLPRFYDLADERGLLVLQDFPLQWGYDDSARFAEEGARQAREMVSLLYNHPSIVFWAGMNEAPFSCDWMRYKYPDYDPDQNRLLDREVSRALRKADASRPSQGNAHPAQHAWAGWYDGSYKSFSRPTVHRMLTEFGAQAVPALTTLKTFIPPDALWPVTEHLEKWEYHGFQLRELREIAKVPLGSSVEELIRNTQTYQARLLQFASENLRRQKWQPVAGIFQFMFVEHWPSMNWGIVDYLRKPKLGYAALARAYQPVLPIAVLDASRRALRLHVINDGLQPRAHCSLTLRSIPERTPPMIAPIDVPANDVVLVTDGDVPAADAVVTLELTDPSGAVIARNAYEPGYFQP